jgi:PhoH-like ATPase
VITTVLPALANCKADNQILAVVMHLQHLHTKRSVILVSKDINMRIKARSHCRRGLLQRQGARDPAPYSRELPADSGTGTAGWSRAAGRPHLLPGHGAVVCRCSSMSFYQEQLASSRSTCWPATVAHGESVDALGLHAPEEQSSGITARNREQNFALNLLMNSDVDFISLL